MIFISLRLFNERIINENADKAEMLSKIVARSIDGDSIDRYINTLEKDDEYERILELMRVIQVKPEVLYVYVVRVTDSGMLFVFDADDDESTRVELGEFEEWFGDSSSISYEEFKELASNNEPIRDISYSEWGWLITVFEPIYRSDGSITAYVCVDISMDEVMLEMRRLERLVTLVVSVFFLVVIAVNIVTILWISHNITKREEMEQILEDNFNYSKKLTNTLVKIAESPSFSTGDLKAALELISKKGCIALNASKVGIWSIDKGVEMLKSIAYYDSITQTHSANVNMEIKDCVEYIDLLKTERLIVTDNAREPNPLSGIFERYYGPELLASLDAPIKIGGKLVGVVCIEQDSCEKYPDSREWTREEQNFAS